MGFQDQFGDDGSGKTHLAGDDALVLEVGHGVDLAVFRHRDLKNAGIKRHQMPQVGAFFVEFATAVVGIESRVGVGPAQIGTSAVDRLAVAHAAAGSVG